MRSFDSTIRRPHELTINGFTFIEIMLVAMVLAVLVVSVVPRFAQTAMRLRAEQTAGEFAQLMRYAGEIAVTQGKQIAWVWDDSEAVVRLEAIAADAKREPVQARMSRSMTVHAELTVSVIDEEANPLKEVIFYPDGTTERAYAVVRTASRAFTVHVDPATSQVAVTAGDPAL